MPDVHAVVGALPDPVNLVVAVWGYLAYRRNAPPGGAFTQVLAVAQTLVIAQACLGLFLVSEGHARVTSCTSSTGCCPLLAIAYPYALRGEDGRKQPALLLDRIGVVAPSGSVPS